MRSSFRPGFTLSTAGTHALIHSLGSLRGPTGSLIHVLQGRSATANKGRPRSL